MKIKELIEILAKHPNQNADIMLTLNVINADEDEYDVEAELTVFREDDFYDEFVEILVTPIDQKS